MANSPAYIGKLLVKPKKHNGAHKNVGPKAKPVSPYRGQGR